MRIIIENRKGKAMDMMDTIELKTIKEQAKKVVEELLEAAKMRAA